MPRLLKTDLHSCLYCKYQSVRSTMKKYLTSAGKKGPRCTGLRKVITDGLWKQILSHYIDDTPLPDLSGYCKRSPGRPHSPWSTASRTTKWRGSKKIENLLTEYSDGDQEYIFNALRHMVNDRTLKRTCAAVLDGESPLNVFETIWGLLVNIALCGGAQWAKTDADLSPNHF